MAQSKGVKFAHSQDGRSFMFYLKSLLQARIAHLARRGRHRVTYLNIKRDGRFYFLHQMTW